jgi:hypothetical protein
MAGRLVLTIILVLSVTFPNTVLAVDNSQSMSARGLQSAAGTAPKRLALAIVTANQDSLLTIKINNVTHKILIDEKTKITSNGKPLHQSDIKTGMKVRITFVDRAGSKLATAIDVRSDAELEATAPIPASPPPPSLPPTPGSKAPRTIR